MVPAREAKGDKARREPSGGRVLPEFALVKAYRVLDVDAERPEGFDAKTVSVAKQNAEVLKFKSAEFEED